ncbi:hypothetical protein DMB92_02965 [Campylobacter sp. MIT 99-7217]|uniref:hypothetical protein n=1 Tax=Campylobacter sp. MIT 99-7217 TaxID=535091 RepID=UPI00115817E2|nr:hypothetical protein [Campylobacter sp. MIT 99-7217]TQR33857.1 hypothetical protein DMB92_02965 [Campylobacter sp. MIT 99-7217]
MRKIWIFLAFFINFTHSQILDAVAITVNNEPITLYQISQAMKELKLSKDEAISVLIDDRVEESQIKKFGIFVNNYELDTQINQMLSQSGTDIERLKLDLKAQNKSYDEFRENFKENLLKKKLYEAIGTSFKADVSEDGARKHYEIHHEDFLFYTQIQAMIYTSNDEKTLEEFKSSGRKKGDIKQIKENLNLQNSDPRLLAFLSRLKIGESSIVLENQGEFMLYKVVSKNAPEALNFEQVKNEVIGAYVNFQRENYIKDFLTKARISANIRYIR